jgi:hypothetical protein
MSTGPQGRRPPYALGLPGFPASHRAGLAFLVLLVAGLVAFHRHAPNGIAPIHDASFCVSFASSSGLLLQHGDLAGFWSVLRGEANVLLSLVYFSLASLLFGPGRPAWGWAWAAAAAGFLIGIPRLRPPGEGREALRTASILFLAGAPLLYRPGGLLDERFDPLAALLLSAAAASLAGGRRGLAAALTVAAVAAKGPALAVGALLWATALLTGAAGVRALAQDLKSQKAKWVALVAGTTLYLSWALPSILDYNLIMDVPGGAEGSVIAFLRGAPAHLWPDRWSYPRAVLLQAPFLVLLLAGATHAAGKSRGSDRHRSRQLAAWGVLFGASIYLLFAAHPVHSSVLIVWFAPAVWPLAAACAEALSPRRAPLLTLGAALVVALQIARAREPAGTDATYPRALATLRDQAAALGAALSRAGLEGKRVVVATSFAYVPAPGLSYHPDTYRVLLFEAMGRRASILAPWELGARRGDWRAELALFADVDAFLVLVTPEADDAVHPRTRAKPLSRSVLQAADPSCAVELPAGGELPLLGRVTALLVGPGLKGCLLSDRP